MRPLLLLAGGASLLLMGCAAGDDTNTRDDAAADVHRADGDASSDAPLGVDASESDASRADAGPGGDTGGEPDARSDADAGADADASSSPDAGADASLDVAADASLDAGADVSSDVGPDAPIDAGPTVCGLLTVACPTGCCPVPALDLAPRGDAPSVAVDALGYVYVSYTIPRSTVWGTGLAIFNPTSAAWSVQELSGGSYRSVVRVDGTGRVHQVYGAESSGGFVTYRFSDDHGATWTSRPSLGALAIGGGLDLALGAGGVPHVVFQRARSDVWSDLVYATWTGSAWSTTVLDAATTEKDHPMIALGFADRPHVLSMAYEPDGSAGHSVRHAFYDGARWVYENAESGQSYGTDTPAADYYLASQLAVLADDSVRAIYPRRIGSGATQLVVATRTPGTTGTWTPTALAGLGTFHDAWYQSDVGGAPAIVADGLTSFRRGADGTFASTSVGLAGTQPGVAQVGTTLYVAYASSEPSTAGHLYFTRVTP